jgi:hypothetical protein
MAGYSYRERARKPRSFEGGDEWPYLIWGVMGWATAPALQQFAEPSELQPYRRYTRTILEYAQLLAYLAE